MAETHGNPRVNELEQEMPAKDRWIAEEVKDHDEISPENLSISQIDELDALRSAEDLDHDDPNAYGNDTYGQSDDMFDQEEDIVIEEEVSFYADAPLEEDWQSEDRFDIDTNR